MMVPATPELSSPPTPQERFALNLWRTRRRADLSQEDLANLIGVRRSAISPLERGLRLPRIDTILKLAAAMKVSPCLLLEGMQWRPGRYVDGNFCVEHPGASLRRGSLGSAISRGPD
jgi:transcriptional regulator with XRE-family HTH domain